MAALALVGAVAWALQQGGDESGIAVRLHPAAQAVLRATVPQGDQQTESSIAARLRQVQHVKGSPVLTPPRSPSPADVPSEDQLRALFLQRHGTELAQIRIRASRNGRQLPEGRHQFAGRLEKPVGGLVRIRQTDGATLTFDFKFSPGVNVEALPARDRVRGLFSWRATPVGEVVGLAIRDEAGLLFALETRRVFIALRPADLPEFVFRQHQDDLGNPVYTTACERIFFPDVEVSGRGQVPVIIGHGRYRLVRREQTAYLVRIVRSQHTEEVPCGESFEEAPWQLEYLIRRVDDPAERRALERSFDLPQDGRYPSDLPRRDRGADTPPNPTLHGDSPPVPKPGDVTRPR